MKKLRAMMMAYLFWKKAANCFFIGDLDLMLRRLDHFLDLIGRPEERRQTDDDMNDDGQQIAARGLRGAVAHAGEEHDQGGTAIRPAQLAPNVGEDHAQTDSLARSPESDVKRRSARRRAYYNRWRKMVTSR